MHRSLAASDVMSFWTRNPYEHDAQVAEDLSYSPSGGRLKMWLLGFFLALIPLGYGVHCLMTGHARFFGRLGSHLDLDGTAATSLAIAYIAVGLFMHAHWFWGLHLRLFRFSQISEGIRAAGVYREFWLHDVQDPCMSTQQPSRAAANPTGATPRHGSFMQHHFKRITIALLILASTCCVRAEIVVHELGSTAANTLHSLSRNVLIGCIVLAIGIVAAAFISKKK
jgi:hypothetical protein